MPWQQEAMKDVVAAKSFGELLSSFDPEISEWGNPCRECLASCTEYIGVEANPGN